MLPWAVRNLASGTIVGSTRYHDIVADIDRVEIGYTWYAKSWQRSHVNTSCKLLLLTHAFETLGCKVVGLRTDKFNFASQRAIEALGAKKDGVIRHFGDAPRRLRARRRDVQHHRERVARSEAAPDAAACASRHARGRGRKRMNRLRVSFAVAAACERRSTPRRNRPTSCCSTARSSRSTRESSLREALAIRDGKILALGSTAEIRRLAGPATRVVELGGRTVIPGLIDSHLHAVRAALSLQHRGQLDRRALARRSAAANQRRRARAARRVAGSSSPAAGTSCSSRSGAGRRRPSSRPRRRTIPSTCSSATAGS